jgi:hypothetical protein
MEKHGERTHALLAASKSDRWINCPPSARLEEAVPNDSQTPYAREGELAHELAQLMIEYEIIGSISSADYDARFEQIVNDPAFDEEMLDEVPKYVDFCDAEFTRMKQLTPDAMMLVEQKVDFHRFVPEGFGTDDCIIIANDLMYVIDLKYGKGVLVSAEENSQLKLYAIGALEQFGLLYNINTVRLVIAQPRRDNFSVFDISVADLYEWAENTLVAAAQMAWEGSGKQKAGDWCKFCKVKAQCKTLAEERLKVTKHDFADPYLLTDDEIAEILKSSFLIKEWLNGLEAYALKAALEGKKWPGYKLVAGPSRRKWLDENKVVETLLTQPDLSEEDIFVQKLNGITIIEKKLGKKRFNELLADLIVKPEGAPTLAEETDKRPEYGITQAQIDFTN